MDGFPAPVDRDQVGLADRDLVDEAPQDDVPDDEAPDDEGLAGEDAGAGLEADLGTLASIEAELDEVEHALRRLDDGSYGRCEACGAPLAEAVLVDVPTARFCGAHLPMAPGKSLP